MPPAAATAARPAAPSWLAPVRMTPSRRFAVHVRGRFEQHVNRRPRKVHRAVGRQRERRPALDQQMVVRRREVHRARLDRLLVRRLAHRRRAPAAEDFVEQAAAVRAAGAAPRTPARGMSAGSAGSSTDSASTPPADAPITTASIAPAQRGHGRHARVLLLEDPLGSRELGERVGVRREAQRFLRADAEEALAAQRVAKQAERPVLQLAVEVDQHVPARHQLHLGEDAVGRQAVIGEHDVGAQRLVEHRAAVVRRVVVGQRRRRAGAPMVLGEAGDPRPRRRRPLRPSAACRD